MNEIDANVSAGSKSKNDIVVNVSVVERTIQRKKLGQEPSMDHIGVIGDWMRRLIIIGACSALLKRTSGSLPLLPFSSFCRELATEGCSCDLCSNRLVRVFLPQS